MTTVELRSRVGGDGTLTLNVPLGLPEANREVVVVVRAADERSAGDAAIIDQRAWARFVEETAGSIPDPAFVRHDPGDYEQREKLP